MCDRCNEFKDKLMAQATAPAIDALEALANGEQIPEQEDTTVAVPLMIGQLGPDQIAFVTNQEGFELISRILRATGLMVPMNGGDQG